MPRVGLCMIVKNEAHVLERCLNSVRPFVDHWTIVDTGSTDGTQQLVRELLAGVPGQLLERPWRDFGHNRTEALVAARAHAEYSLVIDADELLTTPAGFAWPRLEADEIRLQHRTGSTVYWRGSLVANRLPWTYRGVLHEHLHVPGGYHSVRLPGPEVVGHFDGGRSQDVSSEAKYERDARVLQSALWDEPENARYQYYLARSLEAAGRHDAALMAYRRRARMGDFAEEVYHSLFAIARLLEPSGPDDDVILAHLRAWEARPTRAEPLASLARYCRVRKRHALARIFAGHALTIPRPDDELEVDEAVYAWIALDEYAVASFWTGYYAESAEACRRLLSEGALPTEHRPRVAENLSFARAKLEPTVEADPPAHELPPGLPRQLVPGRTLHYTRD